MKIRTSFVTNSSSSSYILGNINDADLTLDKVFDMMKSFYVEWIEKSQEVIKYVEEQHEKNPDYPCIKGKYVSFKQGTPYSEQKPVLEELEEKFGISDELYNGQELPFLQCKNYEEYMEWGKEAVKKAKEETDDAYGVVPFDIAYMTNPNPELLHTGFLEGSSSAVWCSVVTWHEEDIENVQDYFEKAMEALQDKWNMCQNCEDKEYCKYKLQDNMNLAMNLGKICIYSECELIPQYVVNQLKKLCEFYCVHMG